MTFQQMLLIELKTILASQTNIDSAPFDLYYFVENFKLFWILSSATVVYANTVTFCVIHWVM